MSKKLTTSGLNVLCQLSQNAFSHKDNLDTTIDNTDIINGIKPNTQYEANDIVYSTDVPFGCVLQCIEAGTTSN